MNKSSLRDTIAQEFVKALSEDQLPWQSMWASQRAYNATTGKNYTGINAMWLSYQAMEKGYTDPRWCTFKQAKDKGWHVKKDEKATSVEFWSLYDTKTRRAISFDDAEKILKDDPEREKDLTFISKKACVFNAEQISGIPKLQQSAEVDIAAIRGQRDTLIKNMGLTFHEGGNQAFYRPADDSITMPPDTAFRNDYAYVSTFLHECSHASGHESRLNRDMSGSFGTESYAKEELRAEIASAFTSQALGFGAEGAGLSNAMDNHKAYIQSWAKAIKDAPNELFAAIKDAEKISDYLIEKGEFKLPERAAEVEQPDLDEQIEGARAVEKQEIQQKTPEWSR